MRVLFVSVPTETHNPYLSAIAANATWLAPALTEAGVEVAQTEASGWTDLDAVVRHVGPDLVHLHGIQAQAPRVGRVPVVQSVYGQESGAAPAIALSWRRGQHYSALADVIAPVIDTAEMPEAVERSDHLVTSLAGIDEHALATGIAIANRSERPLFLLGDGQTINETVAPLVEAGERSGLLKLVAAPTGVPRELATAAAYLSLGRTPFDMGALSAMACGTPVLSLASSSAAEVVVGGESGFVMPTADDLCRRVDDLGWLKPARGRARARALFDPAASAQRHAVIYRQLVAGTAPRFQHPEMARDSEALIAASN